MAKKTAQKPKAQKPTRKPKAKPTGAASKKQARHQPARKPVKSMKRQPSERELREQAKRHEGETGYAAPKRIARSSTMPKRKPTPRAAPKRPQHARPRTGKPRKVRSQQLVAARDYGLTLASIRAQEVMPAKALEPGHKVRMFFVMASPNQ
jgi:hypothetical protein